MVKNLSAVQETWIQFLGQKDPWRREWLPTPIFLPEQFPGQRRLVSYNPWGHKEFDTTEWLTLEHLNDHSSITYNSQDRKTVYMYQQMNELRCCIQTQPCKRMKSHNLWPRYGTQVFLIAGRFFTIRAIREALRWTSQVLYLVKLVQQTNINTVYFHLYVESKK